MEAVRYVRAASRFFRATRRGEDCAAAGRREDFHYLAACFLCKRDITSNRDIFMYKGDAAFCSGECRQEQMDMDEALEAVARRQRQLQARHTSPAAVAASAARAASKAAADVEGARSGEAAAGRPPQVHRRPTIANLAARARAPMVAGKC